MSRVLCWVLIVSFALFAGSPASADLILGSEAAAVPAQSDEASPIPVERVGSPEMVGLIALIIFGASVYFFGATAHPHPGW